MPTSEDEVERIYEGLNDLIKTVKEENRIVLRDFNATMEEGKEKNIVGKTQEKFY